MTEDHALRLTLREVDGEWVGEPEAGALEVGDDLVVCVLAVRVTIEPESTMGFDVPVLSMHYRAGLRSAEGDAAKTCRFTVHDDLGTEYWVQSGASGFIGRILDSDVDFEPSVHPAASTIVIRFSDADAPAGPAVLVRAEVPPRIVGRVP